jgi:hypothetical protein
VSINSFECLARLEGLAIGCGQRGNDLFANIAVGQCNRQGAARSPENHPLHDPENLAGSIHADVAGNDQVEAADGEHFLNQGLQRGNGKSPICALARREAIISTRRPALLM